jgi:hypothetical protein
MELLAWGAAVLLLWVAPLARRDFLESYSA